MSTIAAMAHVCTVRGPAPAFLDTRAVAYIVKGGDDLSKAVADPLGYGIVIAVITYLSVIIGELVPKHLALKNPERIACAVAPLMAVVSKVAAPVVILLDASTKLLFRIFGFSTERHERFARCAES